MTDSCLWSGIELYDVSVSKRDLAQQDHEILAPISLKISEKKVAVLGPNGSGKSTFLRLFNGLNKPTEGHILLNGSAVHLMRKHTGFLFSDPASQLIMPTVEEDLTLSLQGFTQVKVSWWQGIKNTFRSAPEDLVDPRVKEVLRNVGLEELATRSTYELSSGQRQLIALASVLIREPELLIADEPTTLLDLENTLRIERILDSRIATGKISQLVFATHDLRLASHAERGIVFIRGEIVFDGPAEQAVRWYQTQVSHGDY